MSQERESMILHFLFIVHEFLYLKLYNILISDFFSSIGRRTEDFTVNPELFHTIQKELEILSEKINKFNKIIKIVFSMILKQ